MALEFSAEAAAWASDEVWHHSQTIDEHQDGALTMRFCCAITNELVRWVLSYGARVEVLEPEELRTEVTAEALAVTRKEHR